jgi:hypothetical protein
MSDSASWFGKVCVRCGTARTSNTAKGQPVCSPCLARARAAAATAADAGKVPVPGATERPPAAGDGSEVGDVVGAAVGTVIDALFSSMLL